MDLKHALARWHKHGEKGLLATPKSAAVPDLTAAINLTAIAPEHEAICDLAGAGVALFLVAARTENRVGYERGKPVPITWVIEPAKVVGVHIASGKWNQIHIGER
jgi:hypothetical protein